MRHDNHQRRGVFEKLQELCFPLSNKLVCENKLCRCADWILFKIRVNCFVSCSCFLHTTIKKSIQTVATDGACTAQKPSITDKDYRWMGGGSLKAT